MRISIDYIFVSFSLIFPTLFCMPNLLGMTCTERNITKYMFLIISDGFKRLNRKKVKGQIAYKYGNCHFNYILYWYKSNIFYKFLTFNHSKLFSISQSICSSLRGICKFKICFPPSPIFPQYFAALDAPKRERVQSRRSWRGHMAESGI